MKHIISTLLVFIVPFSCKNKGNVEEDAGFARDTLKLSTTRIYNQSEVEVIELDVSKAQPVFGPIINVISYKRVIVGPDNIYDYLVYDVLQNKPLKLKPRNFERISSSFFYSNYYDVQENHSQVQKIMYKNLIGNWFEFFEDNCNPYFYQIIIDTKTNRVYERRKEITY